MQPRIDAAGLTINVELPDEPLCVHADAERLAQVLDSLLRNAVNYTDAGGQIKLRAVQEGDHARVLVQDTGIGMEPEQIEALFEPYRQGDRGQPGGGLGLGLTLVRNLVQLHEGAVAARSEGLGSGSEFEFTLPLASEPPVATLQELALPPPRRVLIVDDDADVADMFAAMLRNLGQNVEAAYGAEQGLELCRKEQPDIAFLDLSMPGIDGRSLARRLRREPGFKKLYLVAVSGYSLDTRGEVHEFDHHLLKPVSVEAVVHLLRSLPL